MKVCRIVDRFLAGREIFGGLEPNWYYYSKLSVDMGIDVHVICCRLKGQPKEEDVEGIKVHRVSSRLGYRSSLYGDFAKQCFKTIKEIKPNLIHGHNAFHISAVMQRKKINIPILTHLHGSLDLDLHVDRIPFGYDFRRALRDSVSFFHSTWKKKFVTRNSDLIIANSKYTADSVQRYFPEKPVRVIYNGVDLKRFRPVDTDLKDLYEADRLLLYVGRPVPWKGIQYLIQAIPELNKAYDSLKCILVGVKRDEEYYRPYYGWLRSIAESLRLQNVLFLEKMPYFDLPKYYSAADCLIIPSYPEPAPSKVLLEGQACSCPISATNGGGIPEIFSQESGLLFEPKNVKDLANKTMAILENPEKFRGGRKLVRKKATWEKCVQDIVDCYDLLINGKTSLL